MYVLASCPSCKQKYAIRPDPETGNLLIFERHSLAFPVMVIAGTPVCFQNHSLFLDAACAVQTADERWLILSIE